MKAHIVKIEFYEGFPLYRYLFSSRTTKFRSIKVGSYFLFRGDVFLKTPHTNLCNGALSHHCVYIPLNNDYSSFKVINGADFFDDDDVQKCLSLEKI